MLFMKVAFFTLLVLVAFASVVWLILELSHLHPLLSALAVIALAMIWESLLERTF